MELLIKLLNIFSSLRIYTFANYDDTICDTGAKTCCLSFLAFLFYHILLCICFKIPFTESKCLVSNWSCTRLIRTTKKVNKSNKTFKIFCVIIILRNHYFIILKLLPVIKGFILYQIKQTVFRWWNFRTRCFLLGRIISCTCEYFLSEVLTYEVWLFHSYVLIFVWGMSMQIIYGSLSVFQFIKNYRLAAILYHSNSSCACFF